jgi:GNAT superfamily N-acetyltransferase
VALTDRENEGVDVTTATATETEDQFRLWLPDPLDPGLVCHHVAPDTQLGDRAERFVYETYRDHGYCRESPRQWVEEVEPWRARSTLHVVCDGDELLGVLRTIVGEIDELPVSQFKRTAPMRDGLLLDGGSLAVKPDFRGVGLATELYRHWIEVGIRRRVEGFCLLMDDGYIEVMHALYALPTHPFAERQRYMGGDIQPLVVWMDEMLESLARSRPLLYKYAVSGFTPQEIVEFDLPIILD